MITIWVAIAFTAVYCVALVIAYFCICLPTEAYWMSYDPSYTAKYHCVDAVALGPTIGVVSVVSDLYSVILPMIILGRHNVNAPRRQQVGLYLISALGLLVAGAGIARTYYFIQLEMSYNSSWTGWTLAIVSILEMELAIICACAPTLRAFYRLYLSEHLNRFFRDSLHTLSGHNTCRTQDSSRSRDKSHRSPPPTCETMDEGLTKRAADVDELEMSPLSSRTMWKGADSYNHCEFNRQPFRRPDTGESMKYGAEKIGRVWLEYDGLGKPSQAEIRQAI